MSRLSHSILAVGTAAGILAATATNLAFGQEIAASTFTTDTVVPGHPFATLPIDRDRIATHTQNIDAFLAPLTAAQKTEFQQRCVVVTGNAALYQADVVAFCNAVLAAARAATP